MAWSSPRTWVAGETLTASLLNTQVRDNFLQYGSGTWSAFATGITAATGSFGSANASGRYVKISKTMHFVIVANIVTVGTAAGEVRLDLPASAVTSNGLAVAQGREIAATGSMLTGVLVSDLILGVTRYDGASIIAAGRTLHISGTCELV